ALEALEWINRVNAMDYEYKQKARETLNAIYETLAEQAEQPCKHGVSDGCCKECYAEQTQPVATMWQHGETGRTRITTPDGITDCDARWIKVSDLYTAPPPRQPEQAQPVAEPERWAAYMDGDERVTCYDTEAEACGEREFDIDGDYEPGTEVEYLVAPMINAKELLRRERAWRLGEQIHEQIENDLAEDFADADEEVLSLNKEDYADLGKMVIDFMCERGKTAWWTVDSKREQKRTYVAGSNDEAAHGIKE
ncbi:MAG: hypothetical protein ACR2IX_02925, partial [Limnohabitans sp.]